MLLVVWFIGRGRTKRLPYVDRGLCVMPTSEEGKEKAKIVNGTENMNTLCTRILQEVVKSRSVHDRFAHAACKYQVPGIPYHEER